MINKQKLIFKEKYCLWTQLLTQCSEFDSQSFFWCCLFFCLSLFCRSYYFPCSLVLSTFYFVKTATASPVHLYTLPPNSMLNLFPLIFHLFFSLVGAGAGEGVVAGCRVAVGSCCFVVMQSVPPSSQYTTLWVCSTMCSVQRSVQCAVFSAQCAVFSVQCTVWIVFCIVDCWCYNSPNLGLAPW